MYIFKDEFEFNTQIETSTIGDNNYVEAIVNIETNSIVSNVLRGLSDKEIDLIVNVSIENCFYEIEELISENGLLFNSNGQKISATLYPSNSIDFGFSSGVLTMIMNISNKHSGNNHDVGISKELCRNILETIFDDATLAPIVECLNENKIKCNIYFESDGSETKLIDYEFINGATVYKYDSLEVVGDNTFIELNYVDLLMNNFDNNNTFKTFNMKNLIGELDNFQYNIVCDDIDINDYINFYILNKLMANNHLDFQVELNHLFDRKPVLKEIYRDAGYDFLVVKLTVGGREYVSRKRLDCKSIGFSKRYGSRFTNDEISKMRRKLDAMFYYVNFDNFVIDYS